MFSLRRFITPALSCSKIATQQQQQRLSTAAVVSAMNLQTMCMQSSSASASSSSDNNRNNNNRRNFNNNNNNRGGVQQQNNRSRNNNNNMAASNRTIGALELIDIRDSAKDGREMRLAFRHDGGRDQRICSITIRPQLGPRKTDPHDPAPQFDQTNRLTLRLKPKEVATILYWMEGRQGKDVKSVEVVGLTYKVNLTQQDSGVVTITLTGTKLDGTASEPLSYELQPHQQVQFRVFLENSLDSFFGIAAF